MEIDVLSLTQCNHGFGPTNSSRKYWLHKVVRLHPAAHIIAANANEDTSKERKLIDIGRSFSVKDAKPR